MKRLCTVLACLAIPLQLGAGAQNPSQQLAYDSCGAYLSEEAWQILCVIQLSGGGFASVSEMLGTYPAWSPDGLRIAVRSSGLTIYRADGSTTVADQESVTAPRWSADNARIAFTSYRDGFPELFVINPDGSGLTRLTDNVGFRGGYAWSPDGSKIAFGATADGVPELFLMQADGTNKVRLTYNMGFDANPRWDYTSTPSWSADGSRVAFDCGNDICSINADGSNFTRLTADPVLAFAPVFSPVDGRIAFTTGRFGGSELAILEENGTVIRVAPGHSSVQHAWSSTGEHLAFVEIRPDPPSCMNQDNRCVPGQNDIVYKVSSDGSALQEVGAGHHPQWSPSTSGRPVATFNSNCIGRTCQFDATGSFDTDGIITSYVWDFGDGTTGSGVTTAHQYATGATYTVTLTVTDNSEATSLSRTNVTANTPPLAALAVTCSGLTCTFDGSASSDSDGTILQYTWAFGDGSSLQYPGATATHAYNAAGTYQSRLTVSDMANQTATVTRTVTVMAPPPPPPPPPPPVIVEMHVGNLSGSSTSATKTWNALVTVQIHRDTHQVLEGVTVSGTWSDGATGTCQTDAGGKCVFSRNGLPTKTSTITLTVAGAAFATYVYKPTANHDADGDSNGTSIIVRRR